MTMKGTAGCTRLIGAGLIVFAIAFNIPYAWLGANFDYPDILRKPAGEILTAFGEGGAPLILAWGGFALAALFFAPAAVAVAKVTRTPDNDASAVAALGVAAAITQAIGLSRWVYVVPGLAETWAVDIMQRPVIETTFRTLHQFAGVGIGEAIGQTLTGLWMVGVAKSQADHPRFGKPVAILGGLGGLILLFGLGEGLATVMPFDAGLFGLAAPIGFLVLTVWLIWTGVQCIRKPALP